VYSKTSDTPTIRKNIGLLLSSYTKAINRGFERKGSLFQPHTKAKEIIDESYLITLVSYIHQNPIRAKLVSHLENWPYSSYPSLIEMDGEQWNKNEELSAFFPTQHDFQSFSEDLIESVREEFWV